VNAPAREAKEAAEKLSIRNERTIKLTLFSLQKYIRVCIAFFLRRGYLNDHGVVGGGICARVFEPQWVSGIGCCDIYFNRQYISGMSSSQTYSLFLWSS
jgi:hypothetical protein